MYGRPALTQAARYTFADRQEFLLRKRDQLNPGLRVAPTILTGLLGKLFSNNAEPDRSENDLDSLTPESHPSTVFHITHEQHALRILEDSEISADLVKDESKLNKTRTRVVWLSPNVWKQGFRYGNIRFPVSWDTLIRGKRYYWVESIAYNTPACRILISDNEYTELTPYDPATDNGPWIFADGKHYYNGDFCLEVLVDTNIPISNVSAIQLVDHHPNQCALKLSGCKGRTAGDAGAVLIAHMFARGLELRKGFTRRHSSGDILPTRDTVIAIANLRKAICESYIVPQWGTMSADHPAAGIVAGAVVSAMARVSMGAGAESDVTALLSTFVDSANFVTAFDVAFTTALGLNNPSFLRDWRVFSL